MKGKLSHILSTCQNLIVGDLKYNILTEEQKFTAINAIFAQIDAEKEDAEILQFQKSMNYRKMKDWFGMVGTNRKRGLRQGKNILKACIPHIYLGLMSVMRN